MTEHICLSICIPTKNQPDRLKATVASILKQLRPEIEILIIDDSESIDVNYSSTSMSITHIQGQKKGVDTAIFQLVTAARGKFIWFLGDDFIVEGAIKQVLNLITHNSAVDFYWLNAAQYDEYLPSTELQLVIYRDKDLYITKLGDQLGFLSSLLIKKSTILLDLEKDKIYLGTQWISIYFALKSISNAREIGLVTTALMATEKRNGPSNWYDVMQVFGINLPRIYKHYMATNSFSKKALNTIICSNLISLVKTIFVGKALNTNLQYWKGRKYISILYKEHKNIFTFYLLMPILLLPSPICRLLYSILKKCGYKTPVRFSI